MKGSQKNGEQFTEFSLSIIVMYQGWVMLGFNVTCVKFVFMFRLFFKYLTL
jgi:hypothetical protein